jgi:hypothetical protein
MRASGPTDGGRRSGGFGTRPYGHKQPHRPTPWGPPPWAAHPPARDGGSGGYYPPLRNHRGVLAYMWGRVCRGGYQPPAAPGAAFVQGTTMHQPFENPGGDPYKLKRSKANCFGSLRLSKKPTGFFDSLKKCRYLCATLRRKSPRCARRKSCLARHCGAFDPIRGGLCPLELPPRSRSVFPFAKGFLTN